MIHLASYGYVVVAESAAGREGQLRSLDALQVQNKRKNSGYYRSLDTERVAATGLSTLGNPRIRSTVILNGGSDGQDLSKLCAPVLYILDREDDASYQKGVEDFRRIDHVPVVLACSEMQGMPTLMRPRSHQVAEWVRLWLDYTLRGREAYENTFRFAQLPDGFDAWYITSKNYQENEYFALAPPADKDEEHIDYDEFGHRQTIHAVSSPGLEVYRPVPGRENGTSLLVFPGGGLFNLAWESELHDIANFLNAKGITVFGVKYRTRTDPRDQEAMGKAARDAIDAMRFVKSNASKWNIDPDKIGWMGFSAGGMVQTAALMTLAEDSDMPYFLCSIYGPSGADIVVPDNAPKLFVSVHADHPNVFALCQTLFSEWKKAGKDAEMHIWGYNTGGHFCLGKKDPDRNTVRASWKESLYGWLVSNDFVL